MNVEERVKALRDLEGDLAEARNTRHGDDTRPEMICAQGIFLVARQLEVLIAKTGEGPKPVNEKGARRPEELPLQPLFRESEGHWRFVANEFVRWMLDEGKRAGIFTIDSLARLGYPDDHFAQLLQLVGYDLSGFSTHCHVPRDVWARVATALAGRREKEGP